MGYVMPYLVNNVSASFAAAHGLQNTGIIDVKLGNGIGVGLRKADDELEGKLNAAIDEMKKDGSLDDLIVKWFPDKQKPIFATN